MKVYNKLVRDLIPAIIVEQYKTTPHTRILADTEYAHALRAKLQEEVTEFLNANAQEAPEELADILEVMYALAKLEGITPEALEVLRAQKATKRGAFKQKIFLEYVD